MQDKIQNLSTSLFSFALPSSSYKRNVFRTEMRSSGIMEYTEPVIARVFLYYFFKKSFLLLFVTQNQLLGS